MPLGEDLRSGDLDRMLARVDFLTSITDQKRIECDNLADELLQKYKIDKIIEILSKSSGEVFETQDLLTVIDDRINDSDRVKEHISDILVELDASRIQKIRDGL
jgi:DNA-binding winged helix-turn-helix (wHTH) protein